MAHILDDACDLVAAEIAEISVHNGNPGDNGANEISGSGTSGAYSRLAPTYPAAVGGATDLAAPLEFVGQDNQQATHIGYWRAGTPTTFWEGREIVGQPVTFNSDGRLDVTTAPVSQEFPA